MNLNRKNIFFYLKIFVVIYLVYLFFNKFDFIEILLIIKEINIFFIFILFLNLLIIHLLKTIRLNILMNNFSFRQSLEFFSKINLFNGMISFRSGDFYFLYKIQNLKNKVSQKAIEYIKIYLTDLSLIFLLLLLVINIDKSVFTLIEFNYDKILINLILLFFFLTLIICISSSSVLSFFLNNLIKFFNKFKFFKKFDLEVYKPKKIIEVNFNILLLSLAITILYLLSIYVTLNAFFDEDYNIIISVLIYCFVNIGRVIINIPANIIVFHYIAYMLLNIYNYNDIKSASFVIFFNFISIVVILFMGIFSFIIRKKI